MRDATPTSQSLPPISMNHLSIELTSKTISCSTTRMSKTFGKTSAPGYAYRYELSAAQRSDLHDHFPPRQAACKILIEDRLGKLHWRKACRPCRRQSSRNAGLAFNPTRAPERPADSGHECLILKAGPLCEFEALCSMRRRASSATTPRRPRQKVVHPESITVGSSCRHQSDVFLTRISHREVLHELQAHRPRCAFHQPPRICRKKQVISPGARRKATHAVIPIGVWVANEHIIAGAVAYSNVLHPVKHLYSYKLHYLGLRGPRNRGSVRDDQVGNGRQRRPGRLRRARTRIKRSDQY